MPVSLACACGRVFALKDESAGRRLSCPGCGAPMMVPAVLTETTHADAVFERDKFLLRQKRLAISEKYFVHDEGDKPILFVERPAHLARSLGASLAAILTFLVCGGVAFAIAALVEMYTKTPAVVGLVAAALALVMSLGLTIAVGVALAPKRHVSFYRDVNRSERLMQVLQDSKFQPITATFTVLDGANAPLAKFSKNVFTNFLRKRWRCTTPDGTPICLAVEDSIILALLRRFLGPMLGLLRTNFVLVAGDLDNGPVLGEFNRKFTLFDRYVLDMKGDLNRSLDRRVALALGVMLDTGERR